jgi:hypothetical protein
MAIDSEPLRLLANVARLAKNTGQRVFGSTLKHI